MRPSAAGNLKGYLVLRVGQTVFAFWLLTLAIFGVSELAAIPFHAFLTGGAELATGDNIVARYVVFLSHIFFGFHPPGGGPGFTAPALLVLQGVPKTVFLLVLASAWALVLSVPLGLLSAARRGTWIGTAVTAFSMLAFSLPTFWIGLWIIMLALNVGWAPAEGPGVIRLLMAAFILGLLLASVLIPTIRNVVAESGDPANLSALREPSRWKLVARRALSSAIGTQPPFFLLTTAVLVTGLVSVERVFGWSGAARLVLNPGGLYAVVFVFGLLTIAGLFVRDLYFAVREGVPVSGPPNDASAGYWSDKEQSGHSTPGRAAAVLLLVVLVFPAIFGPTLAPHDPVRGELAVRLQPPAFAGGSGDHILGTDELGRDILSRVLHGYRTAFAVAFFSVAVAVMVGGILAIVVANCPGMVRATIGGIVSGYSAIPALGLGLALLISFSHSSTAFLLVGSVMWPVYFYRIKSEVLSSPGTLGLSVSSVRPVMSLAALHIGFVILLSTTIMASGAGFYGVGPAPPSPELGSMIADGRQVLFSGSGWWVALWPGVSILLAVLGFNLLGYWLADRHQTRWG